MAWLASQTNQANRHLGWCFADGLMYTIKILMTKSHNNSFEEQEPAQYHQSGVRSSMSVRYTKTQRNNKKESVV